MGRLSLIRSRCKRALALLLVASVAGKACASDSSAWIGMWSAAMISSPRGALTVNDQTLRQLARVGTAGNKLRIVLDNRFGRQPITFNAASIGLQDVGPNVIASSITPVRFDDKQAVTVAPGTQQISDPVAIKVVPGETLAVSLYVAGKAIAASWHPDPRSRAYLSGAGDQTRHAGLEGAREVQGDAWLTRIDVQPNVPTRAIVALGDSISNGYHASQLTAWPEVLQDRLIAARCTRTVLNAGIDGNQVAVSRLDTHSPGVSMRERVATDALNVPGVGYLMLLGGINDIGLTTLAAHARGEATPTAQALAEPVIAAQQAIVAAAHAKGVKVYGGTLLPYAATTQTYTAQGEAAHQQINAWIRSAGAFDGVIDFDRALRDPVHPERLQLLNDSGDNLHPSDAGYRAMGNTVPLSLFDCS